MGKDLAILTVAQEMRDNVIKASNINISNPQRITSSVTETLINSVTFITR